MIVHPKGNSNFKNTRVQINSRKVEMFFTNGPISSIFLKKKLTAGPLEPPTENEVNILTRNIITV